MEKIARTNLRYELQAFLDGGMSTFGVQRLYLFSKKIPEVLKWYGDLPQKKRPRNLNALFYARYRVSKNLILDGRGLDTVIPPHPALVDALRNQDEEVIKANIATALAKEDLSEHAVYYRAIFGENSQLTEDFRTLEKTFFMALASSDRRSETDVWDRFVMHNNESLRYCQKRLGGDVYRLESFQSKLRIAANNIGLQVASGVAVVEVTIRIVEKLF